MCESIGKNCAHAVGPVDTECSEERRGGNSCHDYVSEWGAVSTCATWFYHGRNVAVRLATSDNFSSTYSLAAINYIPKLKQRGAHTRHTVEIIDTDV